MERSGSRSVGIRLGEWLRTDSFDPHGWDWAEFPARKAISPLLAYLCSAEERVKWRAVSAVGVVVSRMAEDDLEAARVIVRRLMWSLNDESGGIGWGAPEAIGEILAQQETLASEYACILISYIDPCGNLLENPLLERGVLWGLGRLAQVRPHLLRSAVPLVARCLQAEDPFLRGLAVHALGFLAPEVLVASREPLLRDEGRIRIFVQGNVGEYRICDLAAGLIAAMA